jgi:uncharacterized protein (DUF433 family)
MYRRLTGGGAGGYHALADRAVAARHLIEESILMASLRRFVDETYLRGSDNGGADEHGARQSLDDIAGLPVEALAGIDPGIVDVLKRVFHCNTISELGTHPAAVTAVAVAALAKLSDGSSTDSRITRYIEDDPDGEGTGDARLKHSHVHVWAIVGHWLAIQKDEHQVASDYDVPLEAVEAALHFYKRNQAVIDARLLANSIHVA